MTSIESMMTPQVAAVDPKTTVRAAATLMRERRLGALVILQEGKLRGIVSERDLMNRVVAEGRDPSSTTVGDVCTTDVISVRADASVESCYRLLREKQFRHLPVVDGQGEPVGMVSARDFWKCLALHAETEVSIEELCAKLGKMTQLMIRVEEFR